MRQRLAARHARRSRKIEQRKLSLQIVHGNVLSVDGSKGERRHHPGACEFRTADVAESAPAVGVFRPATLPKLLKTGLGFIFALQLATRSSIHEPPLPKILGTAPPFPVLPPRP